MTDSSVKYARVAMWAVVLAATIHVFIADRSRPQGFDEPAHVAAGMEWLQFHTYKLDPLHPPLARIATAAGLYLAGVRFEMPASDFHNFWDAGNSILYQRGQYLRNLFLARIGIVPFAVVLVVVTFLWAKRVFGDFAAFAAVTLLVSLPVVLSFSALAYTDLPAACMQVSSLFVFTLWLENRSRRRVVLLVVLIALAVLTKFTSLLYLPIAGLAIAAVRRLLTRKQPKFEGENRQAILSLGAVIALFAVIVWGGYRFSFGHVDEAVGLSRSEPPSFQHFPRPVANFAQKMVAADWAIPAPALLEGLSEAWVLNKSAPEAYLFGTTKNGGWWYFFLVEVLFKTPLPFLLFAAIGLGALYPDLKAGDWRALAPGAAALAILLLTTRVSTNYGLRHVLLIFPLLAVVGGRGVVFLWKATPKWAPAARATVVCLLLWQCLTTLSPKSDSIAYFNELAPHDPSAILVTGCDFDCGQDLLHLSRELNRRNVETVAVALWTSADLSKVGLPPFHVLEPDHTETGWIGVSVRAMRDGSVQHKGYPAGALSWLRNYKPVADVGKTIELYYIPGEVSEPARVSSIRNHKAESTLLGTFISPNAN